MKITKNDVFTFDGKQMTFGEILQKYTAYSRTWLRDAVIAGASSGKDLASRWAANQHKAKVAAAVGGRNAVMTHGNKGRIK